MPCVTHCSCYCCSCTLWWCRCHVLHWHAQLSGAHCSCYCCSCTLWWCRCHVLHTVVVTAAAVLCDGVDAMCYADMHSWVVHTVVDTAAAVLCVLCVDAHWCYWHICDTSDLSADWCTPPGEDWSRHCKSVSWGGVYWLWLWQQQQVQDQLSV